MRWSQFSRMQGEILNLAGCVSLSPEFAAMGNASIPVFAGGPPRMRQRLFYKPSKKLPRVLWGSVFGMILVLVFLRAGLHPDATTERWLLPLGLSLPAGALGGYLFALLDPMRARGQAVLANLVGGAMYIALVSAAFAVGLNGTN